jgi:hypothetical protein
MDNIAKGKDVRKDVRNANPVTKVSALQAAQNLLKEQLMLGEVKPARFEDYQQVLDKIASALVD